MFKLKIRFNSLLIKFLFIANAFIFFVGCNYGHLDSKNWPPVVLTGNINTEKEVYKLGDTLIFTFLVPDSLPSLTTTGEKIKIHNLNEASLLFNFDEYDTLNKIKKILPLNTSIPLIASIGSIRIVNKTYFIADFDKSNKPFGLKFQIVLNKRGLFSVYNGDIRDFIANNSSYKAGLFFNLNTASKNIHLLNKHFPDMVDNNSMSNFFYAFYVQ